MKRIFVLFCLFTSSAFAISDNTGKNKLLEILEKGNVKAFQSQLNKESSENILSVLQTALVNEDTRFLKILLKNKNALALLDSQPELAALPIQESLQKNLETLMSVKPKILKTTELKNKRSLLFEAVTHANPELIKFIVGKEKSLISKLDDEGESILFAAARRGDRDIAAYLVGLKLDLTLKNKKGQTAADVALAEDFPKTATILKAK